MQDQIGNAAGVIWNRLQQNGETTLSQLKKDTKLNPPVFEWAIGWLAREGQIVIEPNKKTYVMRLK
jgi:hypothetical protein